MLCGWDILKKSRPYLLPSRGQGAAIFYKYHSCKLVFGSMTELRRERWDLSNYNGTNTVVLLDVQPFLLNKHCFTCCKSQVNFQSSAKVDFEKNASVLLLLKRNPFTEITLPFLKTCLIFLLTHESYIFFHMSRFYFGQTVKSLKKKETSSHRINLEYQYSKTFLFQIVSLLH